jgi:hypothetical protein
MCCALEIASQRGDPIHIAPVLRDVGINKYLKALE